MYCVKHNRPGRESLLSIYGENAVERKEINPLVTKFRVNFKRGRAEKKSFIIEKRSMKGFESWVFKEDFSQEEALSFLENVGRVRKIYRDNKKREEEKKNGK